MKKIVLLLVLLSVMKLVAQEEKKLELLVGVKSLVPISDGWNGNYFIGGSIGLGYVLSPELILSGSIAYLALSQ